MNGIKMSDCRFYVDEAARTVVCVIPNTSSMVNDFIADNLYRRDINLYLATTVEFELDLEMPKSFMGKAVCSKDDEWNEETGRLIAFSRAKDKCYKSFFKRANLFIQTVDQRLNDAITKFNDLGVKLEDKRQAIEAKIEELTKA